MNKNGDTKNSKVRELLYEAIMSDEFWDDVMEIRKEYGIPTDGFKKEEEKMEWLEKHRDRITEIFPLEIDMAAKYRIPVFNRTDLSWYLYFGNRNNKILNEKISDQTDFLIDPVAHLYGSKNGNLDDMYIDAKQPFVKLYIFDTAGSKGTARFIKENWDKIEEMFDEQRQESKKLIRVKNNKDRDDLIYQFSLKQKSELGSDYKNEIKEILIARLMRENGYTEVTPEIVKKVVFQQKNLRKRKLKEYPQR